MSLLCPRRILLLLLLLVATLSIAAAAEEESDVEQPSGTIIGIDLGTTYSCVGVMRDGRVEIIPNDQGNRITPSYVAFSDSARLVGDAAKNQATMNPEQTIFDAKRFIGRLYTDKSVQADAKLMPYQVVDGAEHKPYFSIGGDRKYSPEEVSAMILTKLKQDAEAYLDSDESITRAVVTVPAYFNDAQRYATRDAATIAGLTVERILNEPTAAAIAHGLTSAGDDDEESHVLVFDLGGGTFDVTVLSMESGIFQVLATNGDTHLGGSDFDQTVMRYLMDIIKTKKKNAKLDSRALQKLRQEVERVKRALSSQLQATLDIEELLPGFDFTETLTRAKFESLNQGLFSKTITPVKKVLEDSMLDISEIDQVVLVGGSTRIPKIQALMKEFFNGKEPYTGINPDEAVAYGAAVQASVLSGTGGDAVKDVMLLDVTPLSLGTETEGGIMDVLIKRGTTIPTEKSKTFYTVEDKQTWMTIDVYEGERSMVKKNHLLGLFEMKGLPKAPRGEIGVRITYKLDANGMLTVMAENLATKDKKEITINPESGRLSQEDVDRMVQEAEEYAEQDKLVKATVKARNELESLVYGVSSMLNNSDDDDEEGANKMSEEDKKELKDTMTEIMEWLEDNQDAEKEEFDSRYSTLSTLSGSVTNNASPSSDDDDDDDDDDEAKTEL